MLKNELSLELSTLIKGGNQQNNSTDVAPNKLTRNDNFSVNRRGRKKVLNEATYLAHRLSRALSNIPGKENLKSSEERNDTSYLQENKKEGK